MMRIDRRSLLAGMAGGVAVIAAGGCAHTATPAASFIRRDGTGLMRGDVPYRVVGANMWYAAWLGADAAYGNRARLMRELDRLKALGLNNLRIMAAAEEGPLKNSIKPGFSRPDGSLNPELLAGLDFAMAEIAKRGMTAVVCLGNFWEWSGGIATWLYRVIGEYTDMNDPAHPWPAYPDATSRFYSNERAVGLTLPTFIVVTITQREPGARGDTSAGNVTKPAIVETGAEVQVPLFIREGDTIKVDTRTREYVERVNK